MALTKVSGGILDPGIDVAGIVTATGFDGPFVGGSNGINAGVGTFSGLDVNGNGDISGNLVVGGNLTANGDFTTLNTTLREVELLRVDANSSVAAGIITQSGSGYGLYVDGTTILGNTQLLPSLGAGTKAVVADLSGNGNWVDLTIFGGRSGRSILNFGDHDDQDVGAIKYYHSDNSLNFTTNGSATEKLTIASGGNVGINSTIPTAKLDVNGDVKVTGVSTFSNTVKIGTGVTALTDGNVSIGGTLELFNTTGNASNNPSEIKISNLTISQHNNTGTYKLQNSGFGGEILLSAGGGGFGGLSFWNSNFTRLYFQARDEGSIKLFHNNTARFETSGIGATVYGQLDTTDLNVSGVSTATSFKLSPSGTTRLSLVYGSQTPSPRFSGGTQAASITSFSNDLVIRAGSAHTTNPYIYMGNTHKRVDIGDGSTVTDPSFTTHNQGVNLYGSVIRMLNGSVGIGTTNPGTNLHISGSGAGQNSLRIDSSTTAISIHNHSEFMGYIGNDSGKLFINAGGTERTLSLRTVGNERLRITSNGSIGIGLTDPDTLLHLQGNKPKLRIESTNALEASLGTEEIGRIEFEAKKSSNLNVAASLRVRQDGTWSTVDDWFSPTAIEFYTQDQSGTEVTTPRFTIGSTGLATLSSEIATAQDYPTFQPTLDLNFAAQKKLDPRITFQRNGPASFTDKFGKVVLVGSNVPRFDHDPITGECKGLLIEQFKTNYVRVSTNLASEWVSGSGGSFAVDNAITNPDGSVGAYYHTGSELYHQDIDLSGANTNTITVSLWVKERSGQSGNLDIEIFQQISGTVISMGAFSFDPATEVLGTAPSTYSDGKVVKYPNGWYRISVKATTASGNFSSTTRFDMQSQEHYVWGMQIEAGSFPTSFIPTYGETASRGIDLAEITEEEFSEFYNQTEGSIVSEIMLEPSWPVSGYASIMMTFSDNSYNNRITLASSTGSAAFNADVSISGSTTRASLGSYTSGTHSIKAAMAYKASDSGGSLNGAAAVATSPGTLPLLTRADIGKDHNNGNPLNGHIKRIMYYPKRLPNSQLVTLTS